jgi:hypothetical protein
MSERSAIDEARFAQAVQLVIAAVSANSLSSDRSFDAPAHQDVIRVALIRAYQTLGNA